MVAAPCQMLWGWGQRSQEAQLWLLQTQLSQMEWMCSQVATVSSVYTICNCRNCWFCHFRAPRMMMIHPGKQESAPTRVLLQIWFFCVSSSLPSLFLKIYRPVQSKSRDLCHPSSKNVWWTYTGNQAERQQYTCRVSCSIHVTFTATHTQRKREGEVQRWKWVSEWEWWPAVMWKQKDGMKGLGRVLFPRCLRFWTHENSHSEKNRPLLFIFILGCRECIMSHTGNMHVHWR